MSIFKKLFSRNKKDNVYIVFEQKDGITLKITPDEINMDMNVNKGYITGTFVAGKEQKERFERMLKGLDNEHI